MKLSTKLLTLFGFAIIISLTFCKEKETPVDPPDTRTKSELLYAGSWKWTTSTCNVPVDKDGKDGESTDLLSQYLPCYSDGLYTFKADTLFMVNNTKCASNEAAKYWGLWSFSNTEKNITFYGLTYDIMELTGTKMVLKHNEVNGPDTYIITDVYSH